MNSIEVRFREDLVGIAALAVAVFGVLAALFWSPWWGIVVPCGAVSAFRFDRNQARARLAALEKGRVPVAWNATSFFAVTDGMITSGAVAPSHVAAFESRADIPSAASDDVILRRWKGTPPAWRRVPIAAMDRVEFSSGERTFRAVLPATVEEFSFTSPHERDAALDILRAAFPWAVAETPRSVARFNPLALLIGLPLVFFSAALAAAALGVVQANQLPLADWKRVGQARGRGRLVIAAWATASQCFRFLLDGLPAAACVAIGILATLAFGALVYASQWTRIVDAVWTRDAPGPSADPRTGGSRA